MNYKLKLSKFIIQSMKLVIKWQYLILKLSLAESKLVKIYNLEICIQSYNMSDSEEGQLDIPSDGSDWGQNPAKKRRIKKKPKKNNSKIPRKQKNQFTSSSYRKQKCEFYNKGNCVKGDDCTYSHDFQPDTAKKICKFYLSGACSKEGNCQYSHNTKIYPCKFHHIDNQCLQGINCRFSHEPISINFYEEYMKDNKDHILKLYKENNLNNKELMEFIIDQIPRKQTAPPIIAIPQISTNKPLQINKIVNKQQNGTTWINTLKKDPRQRIIKSNLANPIDSSLPQITAMPTICQPTSIIKQKENSIENKQDFSTSFLRHLQQYFNSYY